MKRPVMLWFLLFNLLYLGFGGLYGGIAMLTDPSGSSLDFAEILPLLPVPDYTLPGLFLFFILGLLPLFLIYALLACPKWTWAETLFRWSGHHWTWASTLTLGIILVLWLVIEGLLIEFNSPIQYITAVNGFLIILLVSLPGVRRLYAR